MSQPYPQTRDKSGYLSKDSIAAIATALGGAIAIIRVSGPASTHALECLSGRNSEEFAPRKLVRAKLQGKDGRALDDALIARFVAPDSFTGEHSLELHVHGGNFIAHRVMEELSRLGVRQALPGEFSFRAVRNGKLSLSQAEAVADLITASNEGAVELALEKMSGSQNQLISGVAESLRQLASLGEIGIDFADQDVDEISLPRLKNRLEGIVESLRSLRDSYSRGLRLQDGVPVAFVGIPNAGKSSFFNALLGEDRSIVSDVAGTTRDVIREQLTLRGSRGGVTLKLEDTAGLRHSRDHVEKIGIERTRKSVRDADLVLLLVDATAPVEPTIQEWAALAQPASKSIGIITKVDLVSFDQTRRLIAQLEPLGLGSWVETSAVRSIGIDQAVEAILEFTEKWVSRGKNEVLLTRLDQKEALSSALEHLYRAKEAPEIDLFASDLKQALFALSPLIGDTVPDDILGRVFSEFCIGK